MARVADSGMPVRINAPPAGGGLGWRAFCQHVQELWQYRALLGALVVRELKARYRNSVLGYLWTLLNPLLLLAVYSLVFSVYMRVEVEHYVIYLFSGLLGWNWLASSLNAGTSSIARGGGALITKALLPPQLLPTVQTLTNLVNLVLSLPVLLGAAVLLGRWPGLSLVLLPVLLLAELLLVQGLVVALAALCVRFRDVEFLVPNFLTFWFFLTPILYPLAVIPETLRPLVLLNPMAPVALGYQELFYWGRWPEPLHLVLALGLGAGVFYLGTGLFERLRDTLAEEI
ncbi:MAG: transport permease protein [Planctomycetota bacterium]|nr:MAG: transport permease protein [Planctomycetota bacterium]